LLHYNGPRPINDETLVEARYVVLLLYLSCLQSCNSFYWLRKL